MREISNVWVVFSNDKIIKKVILSNFADFFYMVTYEKV